jgi:GNAT superfamily N-acetyltransferase
VPAAAEVAAAAFEFDLSDPVRATQWRARVEHLTRTDPDGGFVAVAGGEVVAMAQAMLRDGVWCLSLLTVAPGAQSAGAGGRLLTATLEYGTERRGGLIVSSDDPRALTLYARAGFAVQPSLEAFGDPPALPPADPRVVQIEGTPEQLRALEPISRAVRGAAHTPELEFALGPRGGRLLVLDQRGFAVTTTGHAVWLLVARDTEAASVLLIEALRELGTVPEPPVRWITQDQDWAVQTLVGLGLRLRTYGALCVLGEVGPLRPYIPSPAFA